MFAELAPPRSVCHEKLSATRARNILSKRERRPGGVDVRPLVHEVLDHFG